jgi:hypothetical protein
MTSKQRVRKYYSLAADVLAGLGLNGIGCPAWTPTITDPVFVDGNCLQGAGFSETIGKQRQNWRNQPEATPLVRCQSECCRTDSTAGTSTASWP